jgi:hypothetical protein
MTRNYRSPEWQFIFKLFYPFLMVLIPLALKLKQWHMYIEDAKIIGRYGYED